MIDFDVIYRLYFQDVYYFLLSLSKNKHIAEDLTSQTFFKALNNKSKIDENKSIKSYLFTIAKNLYIDQVRKDKSLKVGLEDLDLVDKAKDLDQLLIENELIDTMVKAIGELDEPNQTIVKLRIYEKYSFEKIGSYFSKSSNWARVNYFRAKERLRKILGDDYEKM